MTISDFDGAVFWPGIKVFVANAGVEPISLGEPEDEIWQKIFAAAAAVGSPLSLGMSPGELMRAAYALAKGAGVAASLRTVPDSGSSNVFYAIRNAGGVGKVAKFIRNAGGSSGTDLGGKWPEWRPGGYGDMPTFQGNPQIDTIWDASDTGAFDLVANTASLGQGTWYGSFHGLGAGGSLVSETITIDGVSVDPSAAPRTGEVLEVRNVTTATNGTNVLTRDMSFVVTAQGDLEITVNALTATGLAMIYFGMGIASGVTANEIDLKIGTAWNSIPLGLTTDAANARLVGPKEVRMRNPTSGRYVTMVSDLPTRTGYERTETVKQLAPNNRTKTYLGKFTSGFANLVGAKARISWGLGSTGSVSPGTNLIADTAFTAPPWVDSSINTTQTRSGGRLTQTTTAASPNARCHTPITGCVAGQTYAICVDVISQVVSASLTAGSNSNGSTSSPAPAASQSTIVGRNIAVFVATVNAPEQRLLIQHGSPTTGDATVSANPAAYLLAA